MGDEIQGTSDPGFDAGSYVDQLERQAAEIDRLRRMLATHRFDGETVSAREAIRDELINQLFETAADHDRERSSRQAWAEEAMRLSAELEAYAVILDRCTVSPLPAVLAQKLRWIAGSDGFSRPVCAVHPVKCRWDDCDEPAAIDSRGLCLGHFESVEIVSFAGIEIDQAVLDVGGDPLSGTSWADPEYKGGGVE